ncbi:hypothetical protein GCM10010970_12890 [Silvimonas iriomotensis]|uniref:Uncharacterized protein n=1 Tax=Silvimonas iriomotensis TaxID=449662 RepID=A0ABQ2P729_9NEIS|nr:hypothetical protein GCM10010970_12890 [Silvimonas iriomotensis]
MLGAVKGEVRQKQRQPQPPQTTIRKNDWLASPLFVIPDLGGPLAGIQNGQGAK